jgi:hypothetical protein
MPVGKKSADALAHTVKTDTASHFPNAFHSKILNHPSIFNFAFRVKPGHGGMKRAQSLRTAPDVRK